MIDDVTDWTLIFGLYESRTYEYMWLMAHWDLVLSRRKEVASARVAASNSFWIRSADARGV